MIRLLTLRQVLRLHELIRNHPFVDGNKRMRHAAIEATLNLNGRQLVADIDEAERVIPGVAAATIERDELLRFIEQHTQVRTLAPNR